MTTVAFTDHAVMLCMLSEHQDSLNESTDTALIEYLDAQRFASAKLQKLREAIDMRDAMSKAREYVGGAK